MFTINVVHRGTGRPDRTVYACHHYAVTYGEHRVSAHLVLVCGPETAELDLGPGERAYIMNAAGSTIDVVRARESSCG